MRRALVPLALAAIAALPPKPHAHPISLAAAHGALRISRPGAAILTASNMRPGQSVAGDATVSNSGSVATRIHLVSGAPRGSLAGAIDLSIGSVARGPLGGLAGCHDLGVLAPGATRRFRFVARWPRGGARDNAFARASATVDERWAAGGCTTARLVISHRVIGTRGGRTRLRVRCAGTARCRGTLALTATRRTHRARTAAATRIDLAPHAGRLIRARIPAASLRRLRSGHAAVVLAVVRPAHGARMEASRRFLTLVPQRRAARRRASSLRDRNPSLR